MIYSCFSCLISSAFFFLATLAAAISARIFSIRA